MRYAIIGCGRIARFHIMAAKENNIEIIALCDINIKKRKNILKIIIYLPKQKFIVIIEKC